MAGPLFYDRVLETSTTTGTGTYTLAGAVPGFRAFGVVGEGNSCIYVAYEVDANGNPSGGWEVVAGTFSAGSPSSLSLTRDQILASSNSGNAVSWAAGTRRIALTTPASIATPSINAPGGRLSLTTGVPVTTSDVTAAGTLRYVPYVHNRIEVWDGNSWRRKTFSEISLSLTLTADKNYDVFIDDDAATLSLSAAWTNDTTRADALGTQDGVTVLNSDKTKLWLGTIRASGTNTTEDSVTKRFVWNAYNKVRRRLHKTDATSSWTYSTDAWRQANGATANKVEVVTGASSWITLSVLMAINVSSSAYGSPGIGEDTITATSSDIYTYLYNANAGAVGGPTGAQINKMAAVGYHYYAWVERAFAGTIAVDGTAAYAVSGINGSIEA